MLMHHPSDKLLAAYSLGHLSNALGVMLACHLESCESCQQNFSQFEHWAGDALMDQEAVPLGGLSFANIEQLLDTDEVDEAVALTAPELKAPQALQRFLPSNLKQLQWTGFADTKQYDLDMATDTYSAKLYKIPAGKVLPKHTHLGNEYTLVLQGGFSDDLGTYHQGDFVYANTLVTHRPKALSDQDCICFAVVDAPLRLSGVIKRWFSPLIN